MQPLWRDLSEAVSFCEANENETAIDYLDFRALVGVQYRHQS